MLLLRCEGDLERTRSKHSLSVPATPHLASEAIFGSEIAELDFQLTVNVEAFSANPDVESQNACGLTLALYCGAT